MMTRSSPLWADNARAQYISLPEPADGKKIDEATLALLKDANRKRGEEHAANAAQGLRSAIAAARKIKSSAGLKSIKNLRDKHIAHYLTQSNAEKSGDTIAPMKVGDEKPILDGSLAIIQLLYSWVILLRRPADRAPERVDCRSNMPKTAAAGLTASSSAF
jgi:hypothetical protein